MKVLVISLERAKERRAHIHKHFSELGLDYEIVDAVDYQKLTEDEFCQLVDQQAVSRNQYLTKGMSACALSHVKVYNKIVDDSIEMALVVEDDVLLPSNIHYLLSKIEQAIKPDEVIALSYYNHFAEITELSNKRGEAIDSNNQLLPPVDISYIASGMAYVLTKPVAERMSRLLMPISIQPDYWGVFYDRGAFTHFRCLYPVQVKPASFRTTLNYAAASSWKSKIANFIRTYKIPVFTTFLDKRAQRLVDEKHTTYVVDKKPFYAQGEISYFEK